jgi:hypothetical protein
MKAIMRRPLELFPTAQRRSATSAMFGLLVGSVTAVACGSSIPTALPTPPPELNQTPLDTKLFIEALFLGTGPLADYGNRGCPSREDRMSGWPEGSLVTITMSPTLASDERAGVIGPALQTRDATGGAITTSLEVVNQSDPRLPTGEIGVAKLSRDEVSKICGSSAASLCAVIAQNGGVIQSGRIVGVENTGGGFSHELGHALFGLCHLNQASLVYRNIEGQTPSSMMGAANGGRRLTDDDLRAIRAVYAAGLRAGAPRSAFVQAGLIRP